MNDRGVMSIYTDRLKMMQETPFPCPVTCLLVVGDSLLVASGAQLLMFTINSNFEVKCLCVKRIRADVRSLKMHN